MGHPKQQRVTLLCCSLQKGVADDKGSLVKHRTAEQEATAWSMTQRQDYVIGTVADRHASSAGSAPLYIPCTFSPHYLSKNASRHPTVIQSAQLTCRHWQPHGQMRGVQSYLQGTFLAADGIATCRVVREALVAMLACKACCAAVCGGGAGATP